MARGAGTDRFDLLPRCWPCGRGRLFPAGLCACLALIAALYGSVGQAGASGFLAVMGLFGLAPATIKPSALVLNLLVSGVVAFRFARAGHFSWTLLRPFLLLSIPAAFLGGWVSLPVAAFNRLLGGVAVVGRSSVLSR